MNPLLNSVNLADQADWKSMAHRLSALVAEHANANESERNIAGTVIDSLVESGLVRMMLPPHLGGCQANLLEMSGAIETLARADASTAWCLAQAITSTHAAGYLRPEIADQVFCNTNGVIAWGPPGGSSRAVAVEGGYRITGRWRFYSGWKHADWMGAHCVVYDGDQLRRDPQGRPINRTGLFRRDASKMVDMWRVTGLRGTGSDDLVLEDFLVPHEFTTWRDSQSDRLLEDPFFSLPMLTLYGLSFGSVALGLAGACLDAFMDLAGKKKPGGGLGSSLTLGENAVVQCRLAQSRMKLDAATAYFNEMLQEVWALVCANHVLSLDVRARVRLAIMCVMTESCAVVDFTHNAAGTTAVFEGSPFERRFRDIHTLTAHGQAQLSNFEAAGLALMGVEPQQRL